MQTISELLFMSRNKSGKILTVEQRSIYGSNTNYMNNIDMTTVSPPVFTRIKAAGHG